MFLFFDRQVLRLRSRTMLLCQWMDDFEKGKQFHRRFLNYSIFAVALLVWLIPFIWYKCRGLEEGEFTLPEFTQRRHLDTRDEVDWLREGF